MIKTKNNTYDFKTKDFVPYVKIHGKWMPYEAFHDLRAQDFGRAAVGLEPIFNVDDYKEKMLKVLGELIEGEYGTEYVEPVQTFFKDHMLNLEGM